MSRILVGLSGGLDSSVAAALLVEQGHEVMGASLRMTDDEQAPKSCCSQEDLASARRLCDHLGIAYYVFDQRPRFDELVIEPFVRDYLQGRTPNPCVLCNQYFKFGELWQRARSLGARLATGHYARVEVNEQGRHALARGRDPAKDQSYFLCRLGLRVLPDLIFPLGELHKAQVREIARQKNLEALSRVESQEVCFAPDGAAGLVEQRANQRHRPGDIVDGQGEVLGQHQGVYAFTIGQRRGLGLGGGPRRYVTAIDAARAQVQVGAVEQLMRRRMSIDRLLLYEPREILLAHPNLRVQMRARHRAAAAILTKVQGHEDRLMVEFREAQRAIAPGQEAVIYKGDRVLACGVIREVLQD